jgi:short-subunit dehydrogenase
MSVTKAILPHFRAQKDGIIINTSSVGGLVTMPLYSVYCSTKWALEGFMESLQFELKQFNIKVKNIEPAAVKTEFEKAVEFVSTKEYDNYTKQARENMLATYNSSPTAEGVAIKVWQAANDRSYQLRYVVGIQGAAMLFLRWLLPLSWFTKMIGSQVEKGFKK